MVPKLIFTSSPSVIFDGKNQCNVDEAAPYPKKWLCDYQYTKAIAEQAVLLANSSDLYTVALRPHLIWGPGDRHIFPRIVDRAKQGKLMRIGPGNNKVDIIYVENAAIAHLQAANQLGPDGRCNGKTYFLGQREPVELWKFIDQVLERSGVPKVKKRISFGLAYKLGQGFEATYRFLGKDDEPRMTRFLACQLGVDHYYDHSRAERDFDYNPTISTEEGLKMLFPGTIQ